MKVKYFAEIIFLTAFAVNCHSQNKSIPKGSLFIIGGGNKSVSLMKKLIETAGLTKNDYIVVLPMCSQEPDTSFYYIKQDIEKVCMNTLANLNFTAAKMNDNAWLDSVKHAKLIYITGGDQSHFMKLVLYTPLYKVIHSAYNNGATIAGTSAGAAVMNKFMITGNQLTDTIYNSTFDKLRDKNIEIEEGLGMIDDAIIDQHFIVRSRYNRLLSALALHPDLPCIGIDEGTAIIVHAEKITVAGTGQVIKFYDPQEIKITSSGLIKFRNVCLQIFTDGDIFNL